MAQVYNRPSVPNAGARAGIAVDEGLRSFMLGTYNYMGLGLVLVRSLTTLGYLGALPGRRYYPTARVGLLGEWLKQDWTAIATRLCSDSGETVVVAQLNGAQGQFISMLDGRTPMPGRPSIGATFPLDTSPMGLMLLSALSDADALKIVAASGGADGSAIRSALTHARQDGYCASDGRSAEPIGMVAILGTRPTSLVPVAIAVCVSAERWTAERSRLTEIVRRLITRAA